MMLKGKHIVLGITGSIAAYKIAFLASILKKQHADVTVIMTQNATKFITPITFETLTGNKCLVDTFDRNYQYHVEHVALAKQADVLLVAPATANVIAKAAHGLADDMLTTTLIACQCPKIFAPAMNTRMFQNAIVQDNIRILKSYGCEVVPPATGYLACGDTGEGKMPEADELYEYIVNAVTPKDLQGKKILVTAGATQEKLDPVRFITNHSTGKMGYAIARQAALRGADVTIVSGKTFLAPPAFVNTLSVLSAAEMFDVVAEYAPCQDIIIKAAAVADYRPTYVADEKIKKDSNDISITLERTQDILAYLGQHKREGQILCGFSMETQNIIENSKNKLYRKNLDLIVANSLKQEGAGFGTDTNIVSFISKTEIIELPILSKLEIADKLLDYIKKL